MREPFSSAKQEQGGWQQAAIERKGAMKVRLCLKKKKSQKKKIKKQRRVRERETVSRKGWLASDR